MEKNEMNKNAAGGTELMQHRLFGTLDKALTDEFQIICSRERELDENKYRIYWAHDMAMDPESVAALDEGRWKNYHAIVFVSYWQREHFLWRFGIPPSRCVVIENGIVPFEQHHKPTDQINLAYWSTPQRGLNILVPVFDAISKVFPNVHLHVFSSFKLYGWEEADKPFEGIFEQCREHEQITYHGTVDNTTLRDHLRQMHVLAYPSIWPETSCLVLMEAMSAGMLAVHPDYGALPETSGCTTTMYSWNEDLQAHAQNFYAVLGQVVKVIDENAKKDDEEAFRRFWQNITHWSTNYANLRYNWYQRLAPRWTELLTGIVESKPDKALHRDVQLTLPEEKKLILPD